MQIVIDIPEKLYNIIKRASNRFANMDFGNVMVTLFNAIANGIILPEKHGRLVDIDLLQNKISEDKREAFSKHDVWLLTSIYNKDIQTLVPSTDKEE